MTISRSSRLPDAVAFAIGMAIFGLCAHRPELLVPRLIGIAIAGLAVARTLAACPQPMALLGLTRPGWRCLPLLLPTIGLGVALAMLYRGVQRQAIVPDYLTWFCVLSACIGACEEIAYRGFVQGCLRKYGLAVACAGGAIAHAVYKCSLFVLPDVDVQADLLWLGGLTVIVGFIFGLMRERLGGVLFPAMAHAAFDVITYGDLESMPWWVGLN